MSSLFNRSKDYMRARKSQSDSPPSSPSPTTKTLRHERLARLDSGGSSLSSADSASDRAAARVSAYSRRENRLASLGNKTEEEAGEKDFKKLYESAFSENEKLKNNLREAQQELADIKSKLERVVKRQDHSSSQAGLLETEKREKHVLERRMSEMEDDLKNLPELKQIHSLRQMNAQLRAENSALAQVSTQGSLAGETEEL